MSVKSRCHEAWSVHELLSPAQQDYTVMSFVWLAVACAVAVVSCLIAPTARHGSHALIMAGNMIILDDDYVRG